MSSLALPSLATAAATNEIISRVPHPPTNDNVTRTNYTLNRDKQLQNKLQACSRPFAPEIHPTYGEWVVECNTAYFELLKEAIPPYVEAASQLELRDKKSKQTRDAAGNMVIITHRIAYTNGRNCCTVNLYLTQSRILINGPSDAKFLEIHFLALKIAESLQAANISLEAINSKVRQCLQTARAAKKPKAAKEPLPDQQDVTIRHAALEYSNNTRLDDSQTDPELYTCPYCNLSVEGSKEDSIMCCLCQMWIHKTCEGMSNDTFISLSPEGELADDDFLCALCLQGEGEPSIIDMSQDTQTQMEDPTEEGVNDSMPLDNQLQATNNIAPPKQVQASTTQPPFNPEPLDEPISQ